MCKQENERKTPPCGGLWVGPIHLVVIATKWADRTRTRHPVFALDATQKGNLVIIVATAQRAQQLLLMWDQISRCPVV